SCFVSSAGDRNRYDDRRCNDHTVGIGPAGSASVHDSTAAALTLHQDIVGARTQFDRYDGHCRAVRIGLFGSRYSEISTVPTLLNRLAAMSFGTTWLSGRSGRLVSAQRKIKCPGIDRRAAPGANDNLKFRLALRAPAQCRHVTGEGYLNFAGRLVA